MTPRFLPAGDTALIVEFGEHIERALSDRVLWLSNRIRALALEGIVETVPTFRSLAVHYDPRATSAESLVPAIEALLHEPPVASRAGRLWHLPICYDERCAPDLADVAARTGLTTDEVVALHAGTQFHVYMVGFLPGLPYMGDLPPELVLPRRKDPRIRVPAGSVAIAMAQSVIYPLESPGGWHLIGATPIRLFDPGWSRPALLGPGDAVRFEPVAWSEFCAIERAVAGGTYTVASEDLP
jgi:KipI family sensor histidine kinase inhibitor